MRTLWGALLLGLTSLASAAFALPEGGQVMQGNVQISQPGAQILQILQSSPTGIINWGSFSIDANQLVQFLQPNSSAATLNRVVGQDPSQILGQLQANGRILLVNPNGMLFGPGSSVNAGSFLASTLSIKDADFLQGRYDLSWDGVSPLRAIVNQGEIKVADGGFLALISPLIDNQGLLLAERGQVLLGATRQATLTVDARGLLQVVIPDGFSGVARPQPETVVLTQGQMSDTLAQMVNHYSQQESAAIVETPQGIQLVSAEGLLLNQGTISAEAGSVRLDSSQATVLAPQGGVSGAGIRALSGGSVVQAGDLQGHFVEVSAPRVSMSRAPEVSGGTLLLDPDNINIVSGAGAAPDVLFGDFPGTDINVSASALNVTGAVLLQANQNIGFDPGVRVNIDRNTQLHLDAGGDIVMQPGSGINATDPNASVAMNATGSVTVRDLQIPTSHITGGTFVRFDGGTVGQPGSNTLVNVSAPTIAFDVASTTNVVGNDVQVKLAADNDILVPENVQWNLAGSNSNNVSLAATTGQVFVGANTTVTASGPSNITVNAGDFFNMDTGSAIVAADPSSKVAINATGSVDVRDLRVPASNVTAGTFARFNGGTLGQPGSSTMVNVSANDDISFPDNSLNHIVGSGANVTLNSAGTVTFGTNGSIDLATTQSNVGVTAATTILLPDNSTIVDNGLANYTFTSPLVAFSPGSNIQSSNSASRVNLDGTSNVFIANLDVPTINASAPGGIVSFTGGHLGQAGSHTTVNATGQDIYFLTPGNVSVSGTQVDTNFTASHDIILSDGRSLHLQGADNHANWTASRNLLFATNSSLVSDGPSQLQLNGGNVTMLAGSAIQASDPGATVALNATGSVTVRSLQVPTSNINAGDFIQFNNGTIGQPGSDTLVNATSGTGGTVLYAGSRLDVVGQKVKVNLLSTASNVALGDGSQLNLAGTTSNNLTATADNDFLYVGQNSAITGASDTDIHFNSASNTILLRDGSSINVAGRGQFNMVSGVNVVLQDGSTINATGPGSRLDVAAGNAAFLYGDAAVPTVNVTAGGELDLGGSLGRSGGATAVNTTGASAILFDTTLKGSQVDWNLTTTGGDIVLINGANINVQGNNNQLKWNSAQGILQGTNSTFSAAGPTQLGLTSGARTIMLANSTLSLPNAASNISVNSGLSPAFSRVLSGGRFAVNASAGNNIRIGDQVEANDVVLSSPGTLIDDRTDSLPALLAHNSLNVTVANISGPVNDTDLGITQAFPFATGAGATVRFNVTGTNSTLLGNRAANLYYYFPQSGDIQIVHPQGEVALYNQPGPPVVVPPVSSGVITSRDDLSAVQFEEVTHVGAQSQIQLSNFYSADNLPSTNEVLMLAYDNPSLTRFSLIPLSSPLVELVVLSPDAAATRLNQREESIFINQEDEELNYWRKLIEGFIIWEADY